MPDKTETKTAAKAANPVDVLKSKAVPDRFSPSQFVNACITAGAKVPTSLVSFLRENGCTKGEYKWLKPGVKDMQTVSQDRATGKTKGIEVAKD